MLPSFKRVAIYLLNHFFKYGSFEGAMCENAQLVAQNLEKMIIPPPPKAMWIVLIQQS